MTIVQGEALAWLAANAASPCTSVVTSLPDRSELGGVSFEEWRAWFVNAARMILRWLPPDGAAIFYQTDVRRDEVWVDKGYLVLSAAAAESAELVWHKLVCRLPPDTPNPEGRPSYSHLLCFAQKARAPRHPSPDVLGSAGPVTWRRGMGLYASRHACEYLRDETSTRLVVDPFCGHGGALAVASAMGFEVLGVESNARRCRAARAAVSHARVVAEAFAAGAQLFDRGEFFEAHEAWELRWRETRDANERLCLQGLIQVAAAFHKWFAVGDPDSAHRLLQRGLSKLDAVQAAPGLDVENFRRALRDCERPMASQTFELSSLPRAPNILKRRA